MNKSVKCASCGNSFKAMEKSYTQKHPKQKQKQKSKTETNKLKIIGIFIASVTLALVLFTVFVGVGPSSPQDALAKQLDKIPIEFKTEEATFTFELIDYDIVGTESLVYPFQSLFRFNSSIESASHSVSTTSEFRTLLKYNQNSEVWELHSLETTDLSHDFSGNSVFSQANEIKSESEDLLKKLNTVTDKRDTLYLKFLTLVNEQMEAIESGAHESSEGRKRNNEIKKVKTDLEDLNRQVAEAERRAESFLSKKSELSDDVSQRLQSIKELNKLSNLKHVFEHTLNQFLPDEKSEFKTRYDIDFDNGKMKRI